MLKIFTRHWELKVIAVVLACALWAFVVGTDKSRVAVAAMVEYVGLPADLMLVSGERESVEVELQAVRWAAARVTADAVRVRVNLAGLVEGERVMQLSPELVRVPAGTTVTRITPARLRLVLAPAGTATVAVAPQLRGEPAAGYVVGRVTAEPPRVEIRGLKTAVAGRTAVNTVPVDIGERRASFTERVGLALPDAVSTPASTTVSVAVDIIREESMGQGRRGRP